MTQEELKYKALMLLHNKICQMEDQIKDVDPRLLDYYLDLQHNRLIDSEWPDHHNLYEILGALKLLRLMQTYDMNLDKAHQVIRLREGEWQQNERGIWQHIKGGLKQPGTAGETYYRWQPFQVFVLTAMYGPMGWIDTKVPEGQRELLPTERVNPDTGTIEDKRRLCTDFTFFAPRKTDKTGLSAYNNFLFFMLEDADSTICCTANSQQQSSLLYKRTQDLIHQLDPAERRIRFTKAETNWRQGQPRQAQLLALSAGGKTKDGLFAQLCCADEFGSAPYVAGHSDMGALVNVVLSSMGPRREPMLFTSTTAGTIKSGPFMDKLASIKAELLKEIDYATGEATPSLEADRWMCILLQPDEWELEDETLFNSHDVRYKVNPMLGIICQHSFYDQAVADSRLDPLKRNETITKLFNVYLQAAATDWISAAEIRAIQQPMRIDECTADKGWIVFTGMDFSKGNDLNGSSFLAYNTWTGEFFGDMDFYISEEAANASPIRELLYKWADGGWITIVPGRTFVPEWPADRIMKLNEAGVDFITFGYDAYNATMVVNILSQWVFELGLDPKQTVMPVSQKFSSYSPAVKRLDYMIKRSRDDGEGHRIPDPLIHLSMNPLWPYCFGCVKLQESSDGMGNLKPVKKDASMATKVDPVQALLSAVILYSQAESQVTK
jgi:phage terminase large subunit-like protein